MNPEQNPVETLVNEVSAYSDGLNDEKKNTQDAKPEERSKTLVARSLRLAQDMVI